MNKSIEDIITWYCQGNHHLEFDKDDLPYMVEGIKKLLIEEIRNKPHTWEDAVEAIQEL